MSMFFTHDPDPTEMASLLIGAASDCVPTGNDKLDTFISEIVTRYRDSGGFTAFEGDAVMLCEDIEVALQMVASGATRENVRELAHLNLMALAEARTCEAWTDAGAESSEVEWSDAEGDEAVYDRQYDHRYA